LEVESFVYVWAESEDRLDQEREWNFEKFVKNDLSKFLCMTKEFVRNGGRDRIKLNKSQV
jgi:hypothetical protein